MTFKEFCIVHKLTPKERRQAAIFLLVSRMTQIWEDFVGEDATSQPCTVRDYEDSSPQDT